MKTTRLPALVFVSVLLGYAAFLGGTVSLLPPQMAAHFDAGGRPSGWMSRSSAVAFQGVLGLGLPLIIATLFYTIRFVPTQRINVPRRDFWFAPERREETCAYLCQQGLWLASLLVGLQGVSWYQLVQANSTRLPHLSSAQFQVMLVIFGVAVIVWIASMFRHFSKAA